MLLNSAALTNASSHGISRKLHQSAANAQVVKVSKHATDSQNISLVLMLRLLPKETTVF